MINQLPTMASDKHRMGDRYSCAFSLKDGQMNCTWSPSVPPDRKLRRILESGAYHAARHAFLTAMAASMGGAVVCVDVGGPSK